MVKGSLCPFSTLGFGDQILEGRVWLCGFMLYSQGVAQAWHTVGA